MLGPIFSIEMLTSARRSRYYLLRVLYAVILFFALFTTYNSTTRFGNLNSISQSANVAGNFFYSFAILQILAVLMVGPAMAAGVIAVERERRTIEYLFATDLMVFVHDVFPIVCRLIKVARRTVVRGRSQHRNQRGEFIFRPQAKARAFAGRRVKRLHEASPLV